MSITVGAAITNVVGMVIGQRCTFWQICWSSRSVTDKHEVMVSWYFVDIGRGKVVFVDVGRAFGFGNEELHYIGK